MVTGISEPFSPPFLLRSSGKFVWWRSEASLRWSRSSSFLCAYKYSPTHARSRKPVKPSNQLPGISRSCRESSPNIYQLSANLLILAHCTLLLSPRTSPLPSAASLVLPDNVNAVPNTAGVDQSPIYTTSTGCSGSDLGHVYHSESKEFYPPW